MSISNYQDYFLNDDYKNEVLEERTLLKQFCDYMYARPYYDEAQKAFSELRYLKVETLKALGGFFIADDIPPEYQDLRLSRFVARYCFPVYNTKREPIGLVGYDNEELPKYLDSYNKGYTSKKFTFLGMQDMEKYYASEDKVFITEGSICYAYLREKGFNALCSLGSELSKYQIQILKRLGERAVVIPDNDGAGDKYIRIVRYNLPKARIYQVRHRKDVDEERLNENNEMHLLNDLKNII